MATRYDDRDYDRGEQNYGRRRYSEYGGSDEERARRLPRFDRDEGERYSLEDRWRGDYGSRSQSRSGREYGRENYGASDWDNERDYSGERERRYGTYGRGYDTGRRYGASSMSRQRYNYPTGFRSGETYGGHGVYEGDTARYGLGGGGYQSERDYGYGPEERGWWDRASDEVASWFGDEEATRRRRMDQQRDEYRGRGPKNYRRSDDRIKEDINDRLSEGYLDASDIEVEVQSTEVILTGTVNSRADKRRAEAVAESVTGVTNVENRLRVKQGDYSRSGTTEMSGTTGTTRTTGTTGATGTSTPATGTMGKRAGTGN